MKKKKTMNEVTNAETYFRTYINSRYLASRYITKMTLKWKSFEGHPMSAVGIGVSLS